MNIFKRLFTRKSATQQFLITYVTVLIPVMLVSFIISNVTLQVLRKREVSLISERLYSVRAEFQNLFVDYRDAAVRLESIPELSREAITQVPDGMYSGLRVLNNAVSLDTRLLDLFIYHNTGEVFAARGKTDTGGRTSLRTYFESKLLYTSEDPDYYQHLVSMPTAEVTFLPNSNGGSLLFHYPSAKLSEKERTSFNFVVSLDHVIKRMSPLTDTYPSYVALTFTDGRQILLHSDTFGDFVMVNETEYPTGDARNVYTTLTQATANGKIQIEVLYNTEMLFADVERGQVINYLVLFVGLLVATAAAWYVSRRQLRQITSLESMLENGNPVPEPSGEKDDEFAHVRSMIMRTIQQSEEWQQMALNSSRSLKQQTAAMIFRGALKEGPFVDEILHLCGLEALQGKFFLGGIQMECSDEVHKSILQLLSGDLYYETVCNGKNTIMFLLAIENNEDSTRQLRIQTAEKLAQCLEVLGAKKIRIALSRVYGALERGGIAGMEVTSLLEHMPEPGENDPPLIRYTSFKEQKPDEAMAHVSKQLDAFRASVEQHDDKKAIELLIEMDDLIRTHESNSESARYLRYSILQPLLQMIQQVGAGNQALLNSAKKVDPSDEYHFAEQMVQLVHEYCTFHGEQDEFERIVDYLEENYHRDSLTQEEVAEHVGLSRTSLSKLFRAKAGTSYIDYITELRMRKAKELLLESDLPIAEVFQRVGYVTRSNYTKKFKDYYGINASDVRKNAERLRREENSGEKTE